jgi:hypothetical protein
MANRERLVIGGGTTCSGVRFLPHRIHYLARRMPLSIYLANLIDASENGKAENGMIGTRVPTNEEAWASSSSPVFARGLLWPKL